MSKAIDVPARCPDCGSGPDGWTLGTCPGCRALLARRDVEAWEMREREVAKMNDAAERVAGSR